MLRHLIGEDIELVFRFSAATDNIYADPGQIEQIVVNLVVNSRDAMSEGGRITIETGNVALDEFYVRTHLGVEPGALQGQVFIAASLMIGAMVSVSGVIGFVGLMVPHVMRLLIGSDHRLLLPASFLAGGIFLCWADTLARILLAPAELPVGIVTAFFGGPFFLFLLYREGRRSLAL